MCVRIIQLPPTYMVILVKSTFINGGLETHIFRECHFRIQCVVTFANGSQSLYEFAFKIASKYNLHNLSAYISKIFEKMHHYNHNNIICATS